MSNSGGFQWVGSTPLNRALNSSEQLERPSFEQMPVARRRRLLQAIGTQRRLGLEHLLRLGSERNNHKEGRGGERCLFFGRASFEKSRRST